MNKIRDQFDLRILDELQRNGRLSNLELAERIALSPSACWQRVKRMEEEGLFRRFTVLIDPQKVGLGEVVFAHISMERHTRELTDAFSRDVMKRPEVMECYATTGDADYLLRVAVPSVRDYHQFLEEFIFTQPGISQVKSNFALKEIKFDTALPLGDLWGESAAPHRS